MKDRKRVLLLCNMYPSKRYPHYGIFIQNCEKILVKNGYDVHRVSMHKLDHWIIKVFGYLSFYIRAIFYGLVGKYECVYAHYASHMKLIVQILKRYRPNLKIIVNVHGNDIVPIGESDKNNPKRSKVTLSLSDYVIAPSEYFRDILVEKYSVNYERIFCSPSGGVNTDAFYPKDKLECRKKIGFTDEQTIIGFVSRLEEGKGWSTFLASVSEIHKMNEHIRFVIIGDGSQRNDCQKVMQLNKMDEYGYLVSVMDQKELSDYYNAFDVFCFPSRQESLGLVGLEAMACGVPCVVSSIPGILTYAKDYWNCRTFQPENSKDLKKKIEDVLKMSEEQKRSMIENELATAAMYGSDAVQTRFLEKFVEMSES